MRHKVEELIPNTKWYDGRETQLFVDEYNGGWRIATSPLHLTTKQVDVIVEWLSKNTPDAIYQFEYMGNLIDTLLYEDGVIGINPPDYSQQKVNSIWVKFEDNKSEMTWRMFWT